MTARLRSAIPLVLLSEKFLDVENFTLSPIERTNSVVDLGPELAELLDMRKQPAGDLLLISFREIRQFGDCQFKTLDHGGTISLCLNVGNDVRVDRLSTARRLNAARRAEAQRRRVAETEGFEPSIGLYKPITV